MSALPPHTRRRTATQPSVSGVQPTIDDQAGGIEWYYDGQLVGTQASGVTSNPMYLVLGYGHNKSNPLNAPATVEVDYVRVWQ